MCSLLFLNPFESDTQRGCVTPLYTIHVLITIDCTGIRWEPSFIALIWCAQNLQT